MARRKLTKPWAEHPQVSGEFDARWHGFRLRVRKSGFGKFCQGSFETRGRNRGHGPRRRLANVAAAMRDAEDLAYDWCDVIARTVGPYLAQFGMEVEADG